MNEQAPFAIGMIETQGLTAVIEACLLYHGSDCEELREARALGVQLLEALGRRPEADRVRARLDAPQALADRTPATDREIFAMVVRRDFEAAAEALNTMDPGRAVQLVVLCGPMVAGGLHRDGLADELFEGAQRNDPVAFAELARLIRRRR